MKNNNEFFCNTCLVCVVHNWTHISPGCVSRHNMKRYSHKSVLECQQLCAADENCLSIEYGVNHGGSKKIYKPRNCVLNSGTKSRTCDGKKYNLDLYVKGSCNANGKATCLCVRNLIKSSAKYRIS